MAGHDDDPARLEPPVQLGVADRKAGHPQPQEERALRAVDAHPAAVEPLPQQIEGALRPPGVVRADDVAAEREDVAALDQIRRQRGSHAPRREAEDGVGRPEGRDDLLVRDHDPGAKPGQPELREAHAKHRVLVPGERRVAEDDAGEGEPVGVVHDERHAAGAGGGAEALDLFVGHHVPGGVGGPGDADRAGVPDLVEPLEVHPVLEQHVPEIGDGRAARDEEIGREAEVRVADVLGRERQEDAARSPGAVRSREEVEQGEERGLAAVGDGDVALAHVPALLAPQEPRERAGEAPIPRRPVVVPDRPLECAGPLHERLHASPEDPLRGRDVARVPAAEVDDPAARGHRLAEVVHEQPRARFSRQPLPERRKPHGRPPATQAERRCAAVSRACRAPSASSSAASASA